jgi:CxxC motif-containing protein
MNEKQVVCIVCPSSCRLTVREENGKIIVEGNGCKRGVEHGISEYTNPMRMLTSTVAVTGGTLPRLPVISTGEVPKAKLNECLTLLYGIAVSAPVQCGDVIVKDICGTGVDVVASRSMKLKEA